MKNLDLIEGYFENTLSPKERLEFNELIQNDEEFKNEFLFQKDLKRAISNHQNKELKKTLEGFESNMQKSSLFTVIPQKWMAAAGIMLLLSIGTWVTRNYVFPSNERIFETYFEPYPNTVVPVVRGSEVNSIEYRAFVAYESGEYHKAINLFNSVDNKDEKYIQFYKALCYLSVEKSDQAIRTLRPLADDSSTDIDRMDWRQKAQWYIALAYIQQGKEQEALYYLNGLKDQDQELRFKQKEAKRVSGFLN
jgi:tetratricopeptide (TPR) repeat protein